MARPRTAAAPPAVPAAARRRTPALEPALARPAPGAGPGGRAGFVLYVGLQGDGPGLDAEHAADLAEVAEALRDLARDLLPTAETFTALSLVPGTGGREDDVQSIRGRLAGLRPLDASAETA
ncbi:hypothetical protein [Cellulomonas pakistanensis]|uniref:Uncharacterized protein n=1 Tax=Cellulomonas pakistanensis TaxID=992287 RepID=A0A919PAA0_9CELL|nr:hypothetical protein [Cellulomonas pakistanensis]GIG35885.1 hypothetical protein Cpa01nite_12660 [Cellulomonas pakistanensis]